MLKFDKVNREHEYMCEIVSRYGVKKFDDLNSNSSSRGDRDFVAAHDASVLAHIE